MPPSTFDPLARYYDLTRTLDPRAARSALRYLTALLPPARFPRALEIGVGTGRFAFPFARAGYRVVGVDVSRRMLAQWQLRARAVPRVSCAACRADARALPFPTGSFDLVYWVHVLHLIPQWRAVLDEALRVVRPRGFLLDVSTEGGRSIPALSRQYERVARGLGIRTRRRGVRRRQTILRYLEGRGGRAFPKVHRWDWVERVSVGEALGYLDARVYSSLRDIPLPTHRTIMRRLRPWAREHLGGPAAEVEVDGRIDVALVRAPA